NLIVVSPSACPWPLRRSLLAMPQPLPPASTAQPAEASRAAAATTSATTSATTAARTASTSAATSAASASGAELSTGASNSDGLATSLEDAGPPRRLAFQVALLLRPMPPQHEWVLTHALVETITNRRAVVRVPCRIETVTLPDSGDPLLLRQRLQREERVALDELRASRAWSQRLTVTVLDLSADGAKLSLDQPLAKHQRLHLLLTGPGDAVLALPLGEVVDVKHDADGRTLAGVRFIGVRMKERVGLADYVRVLAGQVGASTLRPPRGPGR
ncbi:MAG TPA: PilZ domain-containing protein, partial [Planctomycetota bacterium]|nr:PilZ domain-containing protein [Planctomycetota bacterium]